MRTDAKVAAAEARHVRGYLSKLGASLALFFSLMLGMVAPAQAGEFCSTINGGNIDGSIPAVRAALSTLTQITIDTDCTFKNFPATDPLTVTLNFQTNDPSIYLIVFDNVVYTGNMACSNVDHKLWFVNGSDYGSGNSCQDLFLPVESIGKQEPAPTAAIGEPFTYTLTIPVMYDKTTNTWYNNPSPNTIGNVKICDDMTVVGLQGPDYYDPALMASGADLTYLGNTAFLVNGATRTPLGTLNLSGPDSFCPNASTAAGTKVLYFSDANNPNLVKILGSSEAPPGTQVEIQVQVVANDSATNTVGATFINTAKWWFSRSVDLDDNGIIEWAEDIDNDGIFDNGDDADGDGKLENEFFDPLPGEWGVTGTMTIAAPELVVTKTSPALTLNLGTDADFTIDIQNTGGATAWDATIVDRLPDTPGSIGMCPATAPALSAIVYAADGVTQLRPLSSVTDYTLTYNNDAAAPPCQFTIELLTADAALAPGERLRLAYSLRLDADTIAAADGTALTNIVGATQWYSADPGGPYPVASFTRTLTDGTPGVDDHQDEHTITATLSGYYFQKSVINVNSGANPALTAVAGDTLRYRLNIQNFAVPPLDPVTINDELSADFEPGTLLIVDHNIPFGTLLFSNSTGGANGTGRVLVDNLLLNSNEQYFVEYEVQLRSDLLDGSSVVNQASVSGLDGGTTVSGLSDDPFVGVPPVVELRESTLNNSADPTVVTIVSTEPLSKTAGVTSATIGEQFSYTIEVPSAPANFPLYDVQVLDDLSLSGAQLSFVNASASLTNGTVYTVANTGSPTSLRIENTATGIDIPTGEQAIITITVQVDNVASNLDGISASNTATYNYNRQNDVTASQVVDPATAGSAAAVTIVEPAISGEAKSYSFISPAGKVVGDPATVSDVLEFSITATNSGSSWVYDANVTDTLPSTLSLVPGSATATVNGIVVAGFIADPTVLPGGVLVWGDLNGDGSLDIPVGETLVLSYQATVNSVNVSPIINSAYIDWTSRDGASAVERSGDGCPSVIAPDLYCSAEMAVSIATQDFTAIDKVVASDSYPESPVTTPPSVRVGDTVTYELILSLQENTTQNVVVTDALPAGMELVSYAIDPGTTTFNYTMVSAPVAPATGTLTWNFGNIENVPSGDATPVDALTIRYVAKVVADTATGVAVTPTTQTLTNGAVLTYTGYDPANPALSANAPVNVLQPQISAIAKSATVSGPAVTGSGTSAVPYAVDIVNNTMNFQLQACNDGDAPAYGVELTDDLPAQLDETDLTAIAPVVKVGPLASPTTLNAGSDYTLTVPARDGVMVVTLADTVPVAAKECVTVDYSLGFHADITPNSTWWNSATVTEYWSRETLDAANDREYAAITPVPASSVYMTNAFTIERLAKSVLSPAAEITVGELVTYQIVVPANPVNAALDNVVVSDTLHDALVYQNDASAAFNSSGAATLTETVSGQALSWGIAQIPAGEQVTITFSARVANNASANAGTVFANTAAYIYTGMTDPTQTQASSGALTITEPLLSLSKAVAPLTAPNAGDILTYTLTLPASGAGAGDYFSDAFDLTIEDSLSLGLEYVSGSASVNGAGNTIGDPLTSGDGVTTAQSLIWSPATADIDVVEGSTVTISYQVRVLDTVNPGQLLSNSALARWTGLDGASAFERDGSASTAENDYFSAPVTTTLAVADNSSLVKLVSADSWATNGSTANDARVRIGDTATYQLQISLSEGVTENVQITDVLDAGLAYDTLVSISPASGAGSFAYTVLAQPTAGQTGSLLWDLGDITNTPSGDGTPVDVLTLEYTVRVQSGVLPQLPTTVLDNTATLRYLDGSGATIANTAIAALTVLQPAMSAVTKLGNGVSNTSSTPLNVNVVSDTVAFQLQSCNSAGLAPAYNVALSDVLASQLDEGSISALSVTLNGAPASAGIDYTYSPPAGRGGTLQVDLLNPVNPGQCVTVNYSIGFHTDFGPGQTWSNSVTLDDYWSLPPSSGEQYTGSGPASFWMTNQMAVTPLSKALSSPADAEATVGEDVVYTITVPATPVNAALNNVLVSDSLHAALAYVDATAVDSANVAVPLTASVSGQDVVLGIAQIPAGDQVTITLTARVANNAQANAGVSVDNTAAYTYTGMSDPNLTQASSGALSIIEPELAIAKTVTNTTNPGLAPVAGDILRYSVTFTASGGAAGDNFSDAFDLLIEDSLGLGLGYVSGTATVDGSGNTIADPTVVGDGSTTPQTLTWSRAATTADIDVVEGSTVTVSYDVEVLPTVQAGQNLSNSATVQWTGLDDDNSGVLERNGSNSQPENDYYTGPATTTLVTQFAVSFTKSVVNLTTAQNPGANASPGDTLQYTLVLANQSVATLTNGALTDELSAAFEPGTLNVSVSGGLAHTDNSSGTGGTNGTGIVDLSGISLAAQGSAGDTLTVVFEATLAPVIASGSTVLNQGQASADNLPSTLSNQTSTLISSAPLFEVWKDSQDLTGDPAVLAPGDTLRYTITVQNIGNENAVNATLRDLAPVNTTYVANSTTLNGNALSDPTAGTSPLQDGMLINAPEDSTPGAMRADATGSTSNVATITFDVVVNAVFDGTQISNQAYLNADGAGTSGPVTEDASDDPSTVTLNDPTLDVVGNVPSVDAQKTVAISLDGGLPGVVEPGDRLRYTITMTNSGTTPANNVVLTDGVPAGTTYVADSLQLNGVTVTGATSPLVAGMPVSSADLTPPLPTAGNGTISPGQSATVTFEVTVGALASGTVISNQGIVSLDQQLDEPTDFDGLDSNGDQPTTIIVDVAQQLSITKEAFIVGGGAALPNSTLEYLIRVTNTGVNPAGDVVIRDTVPAGLHYVSGSATMNGSSNGVDESTDPLLTADYGSTYGDLAPGAVVTLRFRAQIDAALTDGTEILNTATVDWNAASQTDSASARLVVGGYYGTATLRGQIWHDANFNNVFDGTESPLANWNVDLYRNGSFVGTGLSDASGNYTLTNIQPNDTSGDLLELRFRAPGAGATSAMLGLADSIFTDGLQRISGITLAIGDSIPNMNLPIDPNGVVYDSVLRTPVAGATLMLVRSGSAVDASCFDDPAQQGQVTLASGYYKFDINYSDPSCPVDGDYVISVTPPPSGYTAGPSLIIPPLSTDPALDPAATPYSVSSCTADALASPAGFCEAQASESAPPLSVPARTAGTEYYLYLTLGNPVPNASQLFNNHIPLDPVLNQAVAITKTAARVNVSRGEMVPYTITVNNAFVLALQGMSIVDNFPPGFKYVEGSSRVDGKPLEPVVNGTQLRWDNITLAVDQRITVQLLLVVGSGVSEGDYVNRAQVSDTFSGTPASGVATATVRVVPDPTFDCSDITGKVFDDKNLNGYQDEGEAGLGGVRVVTARGLIVTSDAHGRFHLTCAAVPNEDRGSNFILKLDDRSLPSGYRVTSENPRVQRLTRGKATKFNFGATIHRVVRMDVADGVFEPDSTTMRPQWHSRIDLLLGELKKGPSVLRLSYLADVEDEGLVSDRVDTLKAMIGEQWAALNCCYKLDIETEIFWRRGGPPKRSGVID